MSKIYEINGNTYKLKDKYTLKTWGEILKLLNASESSIEQNIINLLVEDKLKDLLNLILDKPIEGDLYEENIDQIGAIITDFFTRKTGLIKNI